ncbi:hypothetical protein [Vibrio algarum]|uniref:Uncharacterized protein n=1 Tax=Vibrio algarum TaxID=3020714 RepID=A0ABT4YV25_9VIBR|nr:hypothetical protein [Vibrio sp. KJ40-1]MDB1125001.1 hypothetical protein [Vibrio sp. KJ40-1]
MKLSHLFNLFSLIALISLSLSGVAFGAKKSIIREDVRYSWDHKIALHELGFIEASKAIPCPCIWNNPRKKVLKNTKVELGNVPVGIKMASVSLSA